MLAKVNRLKKKKDIEKVFEKGKGFKEDFLILKIVKNDLENSRFAFVVPKKVSKKATLRNKIKRRLRELVRLKIKKIKKGMDLVLLALPGLEKKDFWEMEKIINKLFAKAKLYINGNNN
jgi:ribonuclease P protein component